MVVSAQAAMPPRSNRKRQRPSDTERPKDRNLAGRFWAKARPLRRVATRDDKTARNFLAFVHVASIMVLLKEPADAVALDCPHGLKGRKSGQETAPVAVGGDLDLPQVGSERVGADLVGQRRG